MTESNSVEGTKTMNNVPSVKLGLIAVSRDCFPIELSKKRRIALAKECRAKGLQIVELQTIVENEKDVLKAWRRSGPARSTPW